MDPTRAGHGPPETGPTADDPLAPLFARHGLVVLDGGLATQLEAQGNSLADPLWSARLLLENPGEIVRAHLAFYRAGAAIATTASYQATFEGFAARGIDHAGAIGLLQRSVALASEARAAWRAERAPDDTGRLFVAASIGPYGAFLANGAEYTGRYGRTVAELRAFHRERLEVLVATEADLLACETIPEIEEGLALVELLARARSATSKPLIVYPNSGEGWDAVARRWIGGGGPTVDGTIARRWIEAGATIVGGCCRVSPGQIEAVAGAVTQLARRTGSAGIDGAGPRRRMDA